MIRAHGIAPLPSRRPPVETFRVSSRRLSDSKRQSICRFLLLGWDPKHIASYKGCSITAVRNVERNLQKHGSVRAPAVEKLGRPPAIAGDDKDALFQALIRSGWMYQDEMVHWLAVERGVTILRPQMSRFLCREGWSRQTLRVFSIDRNEELRAAYRNHMRGFAAEEIIFIDESIFNEKTGWRHHVYGPIGHTSRYTQNIRRGDTHAILPAYSIDGYIPGATAIKKGYFNRVSRALYLKGLIILTIDRRILWTIYRTNSSPHCISTPAQSISSLCSITCQYTPTTTLQLSSVKLATR